MRVDHLSDVELALRPHRVTGPVMDAFLDAAAIQPAAAMAYRPATPAAEKEFARLVAADILKPTGRGHWFDLRRHYAVENAKAGRRAVFAVVIALILAAIATLFYRG